MHWSCGNGICKVCFVKNSITEVTSSKQKARDGALLGRSLCDMPQQSAESVHQLETRSLCDSDCCLTVWKHMHFPSFCLVGKCQNGEEFSYVDSSSVADSNLVPSAARISDGVSTTTSCGSSPPF